MSPQFIAISSVRWAARQSAVLIRHKAPRRITALSSHKPSAAASNDVTPKLGQPGIVVGRRQHMRHCIQCTDRRTGQVGCFLHEGDFIAQSPVYSGLIMFYDWMRANGWEIDSNDASGIAVRQVPKHAHFAE